MLMGGSIDGSNPNPNRYCIRHAINTINKPSFAFRSSRNTMRETAVSTAKHQLALVMLASRFTVLTPAKIGIYFGTRETM
jgi:hypothetical protein